jgi:pyruvate/2-oxoglutarate dehydrogenase complex dihydrolipoamide dehydrogenase (E3) component
MSNSESIDRALLSNVQPAKWQNPVPAGRYNLVVIGAGTAGLVCAAGAAGLGGKVALIERNRLGGDCLNYGCVPSKGIIRAGRAIHDIRTATLFGIKADTPLPDFAAAMGRMRRIRSEISSHDSAERFRDELGVDLFFGQASFASSDCIRVGDTPLYFHRAAICTGARAAAPPIPGLSASSYLTNETIFDLTELPPSLAIIGAGPIGCEMAQTFARLGSKVTLIEQAPQMLIREDRDAAAILQEVFIEEGIDLRLATEIAHVEATPDSKKLFLNKDGKKSTLIVDEMLVSSGRTPNLEGLELEKGGIEYTPKAGVNVSDTLQTTNPRVYAAGDICSPYKFTHVADAQARMVIANALFMGRQKASLMTIPWCTYTDPEIAHVGMYEREATEKGIEVTTFTVPFSEVDRALLDGESRGFARIMLKKGTDRIVGGTIVARHAGEMINEISMAIANGLGLRAIGKTIHPYPTQAEAIRKLADAYQRSRLTPFLKNIIDIWLKWQRRWS